MKRILVANHHLLTYGGSETFTYTLVAELARRGYQVDVFTFYEGIVSEKIKEFANIITLRTAKKEIYDLALISHKSCVEIAPYNAYKTVQICHGIYPEEEQPSASADSWIAISEEVQNHLLTKGFKSSIIYNGIDLTRYCPKKTLNKELKTVLSLCQSDQANEMVKEACLKAGVEFKYFDKFQNGVWNIEDQLNEADLVVTLGRGAYEAMACGRSVLIFDNRPYSESFGDGLLSNKPFFEESIKNNCSGRRFKIKFDANSLAEEFKQYKQEQGENNRKLALAYLDIKKAVDSYLEFGKTSFKEKISFHLFKKKKHFKSRYNKKFIKGKNTNGIWEVINGLRHPIHTEEEMNTRMLQVYGNKKWRYKVVSDRTIDKIPIVKDSY